MSTINKIDKEKQEKLQKAKEWEKFTNCLISTSINYCNQSRSNNALLSWGDMDYQDAVRHHNSEKGLTQHINDCLNKTGYWALAIRFAISTAKRDLVMPYVKKIAQDIVNQHHIVIADERELMLADGIEEINLVMSNGHWPIVCVNPIYSQPTDADNDHNYRRDDLFLNDEAHRSNECNMSATYIDKEKSQLMTRIPYICGVKYDKDIYRPLDGYWDHWQKLDDSVSQSDLDKLFDKMIKDKLKQVQNDPTSNLNAKGSYHPVTINPLNLTDLIESGVNSHKNGSNLIDGSVDASEMQHYSKLMQFLSEYI